MGNLRAHSQQQQVKGHRSGSAKGTQVERWGLNKSGSCPEAASPTTTHTQPHILSGPALTTEAGPSAGAVPVPPLLPLPKTEAQRGVAP